MASNIDDTVPADGKQADKSKFRDNFSAAKDEIEQLQTTVRRSRLPFMIAMGMTDG